MTYAFAHSYVPPTRCTASVVCCVADVRAASFYEQYDALA